MSGRVLSYEKYCVDDVRLGGTWNCSVFEVGNISHLAEHIITLALVGLSGWFQVNIEHLLYVFQHNDQRRANSRKRGEEGKDKTNSTVASPGTAAGDDFLMLPFRKHCL